MPDVIAVVGAVASVVGTVGTLAAQKKAAAAQEKQNKLQTRQSQRAQIRQQVVARAQSLASAQAAGSLNSTGSFGGIASLSSRTGANLGFQSEYGGLSNIITQQTNKAKSFSGLASLGMTAFSEAGGFKAMGFGKDEA